MSRARVAAAAAVDGSKYLIPFSFQDLPLHYTNLPNHSLIPLPSPPRSIPQ
jgi:hypothetical protein